MQGGSMTEKLLPCPFCGGDDIRHSMKTNGGGPRRRYHFTVYCNDCHCYSPRILSDYVRAGEWRGDWEGNKEMETAASKAWNSRAIRGEQ